MPPWRFVENAFTTQELHSIKAAGGTVLTRHGLHHILGLDAMRPAPPGQLEERLWVLALHGCTARRRAPRAPERMPPRRSAPGGRLGPGRRSTRTKTRFRAKTRSRAQSRRGPNPPTPARRRSKRASVDAGAGRAALPDGVDPLPSPRRLSQEHVRRREQRAPSLAGSDEPLADIWRLGVRPRARCKA